MLIYRTADGLARGDGEDVLLLDLPYSGLNVGKLFDLNRVCAPVPVRLQRHLRTLPAATASAHRDRMANRDGQPLRGLASGHRARRCRLKYERPKGVPSRLLQTQLRHYTFQST
jgi:hypothetical protein